MSENTGGKNLLWALYLKQVLLLGDTNFEKSFRLMCHVLEKQQVKAI